MKAENTTKIQFDSLSINEAYARSVVAAFLARYDPTVPQLADLKTAVSEAVTNCIVHAYPDRIGPVTLCVEEALADRISLEEVLRALPEQDRQLIQLRFYGNRTQSETAKVLHTTQVQISRRERKILVLLRRRLLEE